MKLITPLCLVIMVLFLSCKKDETPTSAEEEKNKLSELTTTEISKITSSTALSGGFISNDGGSLVIVRGVCWSTEENPVVTGNKTFDGDGAGMFASKITGLNAETTYFIRSYATNSAGTAYGNQYSFITRALDGKVGSLIYNGHTYKTVLIGTQEWIAENLRTTSYNDGTAIPLVTDNTAWANLSTGGYCSYNNSESSDSAYGYLYNWYTLNTGKLVPATGGWRVPTEADWERLASYVGTTKAGTKLKSKTGWKSNSGTDEFGFYALPGSYRQYDGNFYPWVEYEGIWWSSTVNTSDEVWSCSMGAFYSNINSFHSNKKYGYSVRLVRDI